MSIGLLGHKVGMTRVFTDEGISIPVSVIQVEPNRVSQLKTEEVDGYMAIQLTAGHKKQSRVTKPLAQHFAKANVEAGSIIQEFRLSDLTSYALGMSISVNDVFTEGQFVDVQGTSIGKGFAGTVKRHNFRTQDATHGNSRSHRVPGSIGQNQSPGRVFKGKKMCGQLGNKTVTIQSLQVVRVDNERNLILIKGAIPGAPGSAVRITHAVKKKSEV
jgi:large subunit ribosomal protein L3